MKLEIETIPEGLTEELIQQLEKELIDE